MLSVGTICFEDRFCASRKGGTGEGGWVHRSGWPCLAAVIAGYRKGLVSAGWPIRLVSCANGCTKHSFHLSGLGSFQSGGAFSGQRVLIIEHSVMSGCGQGHKPAKDLWRKLWIKFLRLTPGKSGIKVKEGETSLNKTFREYNFVFKGLKTLKI